MTSVWDLLRRNANYRNSWISQVVSEIGDYFNNIAVFALVMEKSGSGLVVSGVMLARVVPTMLAGPVSGVILDRFDRKRVMIASDLVRAAIALAFIFTIDQSTPWLLYALSAALMFVSPFFTNGRAAILPSITTPEELHTANSVTQNTGSATLTAGALAAGFSAAALGYEWAFVINAISFLLSAWAIWRVSTPGGFCPASTQGDIRPWADFKEGLSYMRSVPLNLGIALIMAGWAMGGGAAQILFALFGEQVFHRGASGIGSIWGFAGIGLLLGGAFGHFAGNRIGFERYKRTITVSYILHGVAYMVFSQVTSYAFALVAMMLSRVGMGVASVLNNSQLLRHTPNEYLGRVFATMESLRSSIMVISMAVAGLASQYYGPRGIGLVAGALGLATALAWGWCDWTGRLPEPAERTFKPAPAKMAELKDSTV